MLRHLTAACLAAFFALNAASPRAGAKPPDLPDDEPIVVAEPERAAPVSDDPFLFAVEVRSEATFAQLTTMPKEESVCPYCASAGKRAKAGSGAKAMPSVLDNLRSLEKAATEIDRARELGAAGNYTEAVGHLDAARKLCPGSSYARRAEEVMAEIFGVATSTEEQESPCCPEGCCEPLTRIRNVGACYMARLGTYCEKVQEVAKGGCCCNEACAAACPKCPKRVRTVTIALGVNSDGGLTGSIVLNERDFDCGKCCPAECKCESACAKCEKAAGVEEQVNGLLKACYFAVREGRNAKAADLARQAHALDPRRVEADPLVYKLHMLAEKGQCEECETPREASPACPKCPTDPVEENLSLRPALPAVDPEIVPALDRVLTKRWVGEDGLERVGVDFGSGEESEEASCCPCREIAKAVGANLLGLVFSVPPKDCSRGVLVLGFDMNGITGYNLSRYTGMKLLIQYRAGLPLVWVAADRPDAD